MKLVAASVLFSCAALLSFARPAVGQGTTGSISGFVTDETKAALPGATVTVRHLETDQKRVVVTDGEGRYRAQALSPGKYELTVELQGFRTAQYSNLSLSVGQDEVINVQLLLGGVNERVVVS